MLVLANQPWFSVSRAQASIHLRESWLDSSLNRAVVFLPTLIMAIRPPSMAPRMTSMFSTQRTMIAKCRRKGAPKSRARRNMRPSRYEEGVLRRRPAKNCSFRRHSGPCLYKISRKSRCLWVRKQLLRPKLSRKRKIRYRDSNNLQIVLSLPRIIRSQQRTGNKLILSPLEAES